MEWLAGVPAALQGSGFGAWARGPAYAALNVAHLFGLVLVVGGIGAVDLRLCGLGRAIPAAALSRFLTPYAAAGIGVALASGVALFAADAVSLAGSTTFRWKLALLSVALANAFAFRRLFGDRLDGWDADAPAFGVAMAAGSLALWLTIGALGRMIAYT
jgi:hypothetical protein